LHPDKNQDSDFEETINFSRDRCYFGIRTFFLWKNSRSEKGNARIGKS
jgi:hypothetical protein